jgi:hypothetical protein
VAIFSINISQQQRSEENLAAFSVLISTENVLTVYVVLLVAGLIQGGLDGYLLSGILVPLAISFASLFHLWAAKIFFSSLNTVPLFEFFTVC